MKKNYFIENEGCHDTTTFSLKLTEEELKVILNFILENNKNAEHRCQPKINIYDVNGKSLIEGDE